MAISKNQLDNFYKKFFGDRKLNYIRSPYRICPLGAHVDHQNGLVLGTTLDIGITLAFSPDEKGKVHLCSMDFPGDAEFSIGDRLLKTGHWSDFARGAVTVLGEKHPLKYGIKGVLSRDFPGGGLSSSAAVSVAYLLALEHVNGLEIPAKENVRLAQRIENDFIGLKSGILDQSIILLSGGGKNALLFLDCKDFSHRLIVPEKKQSFSIAVVYSGIKSALAGTGYNKRVAECRQAAEELLKIAGKKYGDNVKLRDVSEEIYLKYRENLPDTLKKRAAHFFTEINRVRKGVILWQKADLAGFGKLMQESGKSSIENYQCGTPPLIEIYEILNSIPGVYGARFSGAGFRGACIGLIKDTEKTKNEIREEIRNKYLEKFPENKQECRITFSPDLVRGREI
jgi:galactokinase